ncbi:GNAT family N-acetyltransferase [Mechercharimyces sp. CAU 1602]|uniref:GNAT family N-acetyltransferase n=1 Tax=Mechercharimyces sp. CAU 1602 TaxID=2973933 RepID=UPI002163AC21|nr:GNAT family N-acetyltransferase [Mechercharimyces sp. CAU 1602]MCS1352736.1 acetyltransferase [Mechercharimyces sp. CAU 1602]
MAKKIVASTNMNFYCELPELGQTLYARPVSYADDLHLLHQWMHQRHVAPFWKKDIPLEEFKEYFTKSLNNKSRSHFMIYLDEEPICYIMLYEVTSDSIKDYYPYEESDLGVHIVIGLRQHVHEKYLIPIGEILKTHVFTKLPADRVIAEPDVANRIIIPSLEKVGFRIHSQIELPHKSAFLLHCDRETFTPTREITYT